MNPNPEFVNTITTGSETLSEPVVYGADNHADGQPDARRVPPICTGSTTVPALAMPAEGKLEGPKKAFLTADDVFSRESLCGWYGNSEIRGDFGQAKLRDEAISILKEFRRCPPLAPKNNLHWLKWFGPRLRGLNALNFDAVYRYQDLYEDHPYLALLRSEMMDSDLRRIVNIGRPEQLAPALERMREVVTDPKVKSTVKRFEDKQAKREKRFLRQARSVVKNRPWMTLVWVRFSTISPASAPPGMNSRQLQKAVSRLTKGRKKKWPTCFGYALGFGHQHDQGGYFVDAAFFFDADEERPVEQLAGILSLDWAVATDGIGQFRFVGGLRRLYMDGFRPGHDPSEYTEKELHKAVQNILQCLAKRDAHLHLKSIGRAFRLTKIRVPVNRDRALPMGVAAKVAGLKKPSAKSTGNTQVSSSPRYGWREDISDAPTRVPLKKPHATSSLKSRRVTVEVKKRKVSDIRQSDIGKA